MNISKFAGALVNPKLLLPVMKNAIEEQCGFTVTKFDLIYNHLAKQIDFKIFMPDGEPKYYAFNNSKLFISAIEAQVGNMLDKSELEKAGVIDFGVLHYEQTEKEMTTSVDLHFTKDGEKIKQTFEL